MDECTNNWIFNLQALIGRYLPREWVHETYDMTCRNIWHDLKDILHDSKSILHDLSDIIWLDGHITWLEKTHYTGEGTQWHFVYICSDLPLKPLPLKGTIICINIPLKGTKLLSTCKKDNTLKRIPLKGTKYAKPYPWGLSLGIRQYIQSPLPLPPPRDITWKVLEGLTRTWLTW